MVHRAWEKYSAAFLAFTLIMSPAAFAAPENAAPDKPTQAPEAKSYLPPWMQKKGAAGESGSTGGKSAVAPEKSASVPPQDAPRKRARGYQGQRSQRRSGPGNALFKGLASLFR